MRSSLDPETLLLEAARSHPLSIGLALALILFASAALLLQKRRGQLQSLPVQVVVCSSCTMIIYTWCVEASIRLYALFYQMAYVGWNWAGSSTIYYWSHTLHVIFSVFLIIPLAAVAYLLGRLAPSENPRITLGSLVGVANVLVNGAIVFLMATRIPK